MSGTEDLLAANIVAGERLAEAKAEIRRLQDENWALREECAEGAATANGWAEEAKGLHAEVGRLHNALRGLAYEWERNPQGDIGSDRRCARQLREVLMHDAGGHSRSATHEERMEGCSAYAEAVGEGRLDPVIAAIRDDIAVLADEWENYECECENPDAGPYCLHRYTVRDFGRVLRNRLMAAVSPYE